MEIQGDGLAEFLETWPRSGMTRNGKLYRRQPSVPFIVGSASGYWAIPTMSACDHKGSGRLRLERGENNNFRDWCKIRFNLVYPPVAWAEYLMGYPIGHTDLKDLETP